MPQWCLEMSMIGPYGERYTQRVALDHRTASDIQKIDPPVTVINSFDDAVNFIKRREYRKDLFTHAATQLGTQLAERMEDAEGWHGMSRQEPAKAALAR